MLLQKLCLEISGWTFLLRGWFFSGRTRLLVGVAEILFLHSSQVLLLHHNNHDDDEKQQKTDLGNPLLGLSFLWTWTVFVDLAQLTSSPGSNAEIFWYFHIFMKPTLSKFGMNTFIYWSLTQIQNNNKFSKICFPDMWRWARAGDSCTTKSSPGKQ